MELTIKQRITDDAAIMDLSGRLWILDLRLRDQVLALLDQSCRFIVLNLEEVGYIDSSGLGQMVAIWTSVRTRGGNVTLLKPNERVRRLLTLTRLHVVFDVFQDEDKAVAAARREPMS